MSLKPHKYDFYDYISPRDIYQSIQRDQCFQETPFNQMAFEYIRVGEASNNRNGLK